MSTDSDVSGLFAERYEIERRVGVGGAAAVYRARDVKHDRVVALKILHRDLSAAFGADRFHREISIAGKLTHPHILPMHDSGECDGRLFYVTPFVDGESLRDRLDRERQLPLKDAVSIATAVATALDYAHTQGIVHRDIKPENILFAAGQPIVADFGIAQVARGGDERLTAAGVIVGTPTYMSPEQATGDIEVDGRSDLYSLGCVLYEMLTGEPPFQGRSAQAIIARRLSEIASDVRMLRSAVPEPLAALIASLLEVTPADRPQHASEVAEALGIIASELLTPTSGSISARWRTSSRRSSRGRRWTGAAVAAAAILAAAALTSLPRLRAWRSGEIRTLAVLPLTNLTGDVEQEFVADGLTESLITDLAGLQGVSVISRTSVMQYKSAQRTPQEIGRDLRADAVVESSLRQVGDRMRVTARLVHTRDARLIWTEDFERTVGEALDLDGDIGRAIARRIGTKLAGGAAKDAQNRPPVKPQSQQAYLRGAAYAAQLRLDEATAYFQKAVAIDPNNASAYAAIARAFYFRAFFGEVAPAEAFGQMRRAAEAALALDANLAEAHGLIALVATHFDWNWSAAEEHFKRALELSPSNAQVHHDFAHFLLAMGRRKQSIEASMRAVELDPANPMLTSCLGWHSLFDDRFDQSIEQAEEAQRMMPSMWAQIVLGWGYAGQGKRDDAITAMRKAVSLSSGLPFARAALANALARSGERAEAREILGRLLDQATKGYVAAYDIAIVYAGLEDRDEAFEWLSRALAERSMFVVHMGWDARLDPLRPDPRFAELMLRLGLPAGMRKTPTVALGPAEWKNLTRG